MMHYHHLCLMIGEADVVAAHVRKLVDAGVPPRDIAVVTPYNMQVCHRCRPFYMFSFIISMATTTFRQTFVTLILMP